MSTRRSQNRCTEEKDDYIKDVKRSIARHVPSSSGTTVLISSAISFTVSDKSDPREDTDGRGCASTDVIEGEAVPMATGA